MTNWQKIFLPLFFIPLLSLGVFILIQELSEENTHQHQAISLGTQIPNFELHPFRGKTINLSELDGHLSLINFWASWCAPCLIEIPSLIRLRQLYQDSGLNILLVNIDEEPETVIPEISRRLDLNFETYKDFGHQMADYFDVHGIPVTFIVNRNRELVFSYSGERDWADQPTRKLIEQLLKDH